MKKKSVFCCEAGAFYAVQHIFYPFYICDSGIYGRPFSKMVKSSLFCMFLCIFALFLPFCPFSASFYPFSEAIELLHPCPKI